RDEVAVSADVDTDHDGNAARSELPLPHVLHRVRAPVHSTTTSALAHPSRFVAHAAMISERYDSHRGAACIRSSGWRVLPQMDRDPLILVVEHRDELKPRAERVEVLAQRRDTNVVGVLELGHRALGDVEPPGECGLTDGLTVPELV